MRILASQVTGAGYHHFELRAQLRETWFNWELWLFRLRENGAVSGGGTSHAGREPEAAEEAAERDGEKRSPLSTTLRERVQLGNGWRKVCLCLMSPCKTQNQTRTKPGSERALYIQLDVEGGGVHVDLPCWWIPRDQRRCWQQGKGSRLASFLYTKWWKKLPFQSHLVGTEMKSGLCAERQFSFICESA